MKQINIVGIGMGGDTLTAEASAAIDRAEVLLGAPRMLALFSTSGKPSYPDIQPEKVALRIASDKAECFAVLVSGDVGFYSAASELSAALDDYSLRLIPGLSTVNVFFARLNLPWQDTAFVSAHGRETNLVDTVRRNEYTFCLTGNNGNRLGEDLCKAGFGSIPVYVGENLGTETEKVYRTTPEELTGRELPALTVFLFEHKHRDRSTPVGLPDDRFERLEGIPMTKSETRAVVLSKLRLRPDDICWDIGAGTGSVTVEMALSVYQGRVFAVECREDALPLIERNCVAFRLGNVTPICGIAPEVLVSLPAPDAVFIGGSGGKLDAIVSVVLQKNPNARIVVTAVALETQAAALSALTIKGQAPEMVQLNVSRGVRAGRLHRMDAQNPVMVYSIGGVL